MTTAPHAGPGAATLSALYDVGQGAAPACPERVGRYQIGDRLGAGAMGVVYRAHDPDLGRDVAIKLVRSTASPSNLRLLREAQAMARLHHPNVVPIFDVGQAGDAVFVTMPLIEGGTLKRWLRGAARSFDDILDRFLAAGRGLAAAHAAGLVHRDFKPDNVLLGAGGEIHVADFGLARLSLSDDEPVLEASADGLVANQLTQTGAVLGTPAYMAPEQLRGRPIDARADQFSFCVALWEGVYGQRPFPDPPDDAAPPWTARLDAIAAGPAPPRRDRPAWLAPLLARGLASNPAGRWPALQDLLDAIAAHRRPRRWPWWLAGAGALGVAAAITVAMRLDPTSAPASTPPVFPAIPLTHRGDLKAVAISPDGDQLAFVAGDSLVIRGSEPGAADRTVVEHGITAAITEAIAWSPDGRHLLVRTTDENPLLRQTVLVDSHRGVQFKLPVPGLASFLSSTEVAVTSPRRRSVTILPAAKHAAATATCDVPGDYTFLDNVTGLPDGTMAIETLSGGSRALVILQRDCRVRATFSAEPISSVATTDTGTLVALVAHRGLDEILEISLDGAVVSRRRVSGQLERVIGRRHGIDYVTTRARQTHLDRVRGRARQRLFSINGSASFSLAPDGETLAWIERDTHIQAPGSLRLSTLQDMVQPRTLLDNALTAGWSPDGRLLAVLVYDRAGIASPPARPRPAQTTSSTLVVIDRDGTVSRRVPLQDIQPESAPVWLDDHRIATQTGDHTTYRWYDLNTAEQHELTDRRYGSTYWLSRSPRDGTLAMWRNGPPDARDAKHLWVQSPGHPARPLQVVEATKHVLVPSWSPSGELLVRALDTGVISRIALDTGEATPIGQLPETPVSLGFEDHLMTLADGDLLATEIDLGVNVAAVYPDDEPVTLSAVEPGLPR